MSTTLAVTARNAVAGTIAALVDVNGPGSFRFYDAGFSTLLATAVCSATAYGPAVDGVATANPISDATIGASGTAAVFRLVDGNGDTVLDGTVGNEGSGADIEFTSTTWAAGEQITVTAHSITVPASE